MTTPAKPTQSTTKPNTTPAPAVQNTAASKQATPSPTATPAPATAAQNTTSSKQATPNSTATPTPAAASSKQATPNATATPTPAAAKPSANVTGTDGQTTKNPGGGLIKGAKSNTAVAQPNNKSAAAPSKAATGNQSSVMVKGTVRQGNQQHRGGKVFTITLH